MLSTLGAWGSAISTWKPETLLLLAPLDRGPPVFHALPRLENLLAARTKPSHIRADHRLFLCRLSLSAGNLAQWGARSRHSLFAGTSSTAQSDHTPVVACF